MPLKSVVFPPYLKKGDLVGIVCPAGFMDAAKVNECIRVLTDQWGYTVRVGKTIGHQYHYFAGTDEERKADIQLMLDDPNVKAILCGRGGYGTGRIIDDLDFRAFRKSPKWIIGFSDITVLHSHILARYNIASLHAPMANAFNNEGFKNEFVGSLRETLRGKKMKYEVNPHRYNHVGKSQGMLIGGNLSLVADLVGSRSDLNFSGKILFLEDIGEYLYNIDRMLRQLKRAGKLRNLAGLVLGGFTDMKDTDIPFGKNVDQILSEIANEYEYPVCFGFPVSHDKENMTLKVGGNYELDVRSQKVVLKEL